MLGVGVFRVLVDVVESLLGRLRVYLRRGVYLLTGRLPLTDHRGFIHRQFLLLAVVVLDGRIRINLSKASGLSVDAD